MAEVEGPGLWADKEKPNWLGVWSHLSHCPSCHTLMNSSGPCPKCGVAFEPMEHRWADASGATRTHLSMAVPGAFGVLRHPEDSQQASDRLLDFLTEPGSFVAGVPELRVTTPGHYTSEVQRKKPTVVIWAASTDIGARSYIGDAYCPSQFRLVVAGHDALTLSRVLDAAVVDEYALYAERVGLLRKALPWVAKEYGGLSVAHGLDSDRSRIALPFVGHGFIVLDGYGKIAAGPGSQFYVLDPASHRLAPKEARSIDIGDAVFVMPDAIREEIEAALREKDDKGRTLEQALVDQYKATVKKGIETLTAQFGAKGLTLGGAPRAVAILNGTLAAALGLGLRLWLAGLLLAAAGQAAAVWPPIAHATQALLLRGTSKCGTASLSHQSSHIVLRGLMGRNKGISHAYQQLQRTVRQDAE